MFEAFKEDVAESYCEYNIGSMQKGTGHEVDAKDILIATSRLQPGEALVIIRKAE